MVLATAKIGDFDRFWNTFSTKGAEKRKQHGCKGAHVFRDPNESHRVWAIFDWDEAGWQSFTSDPEVPAIFQEAGFTQGPPKSAELLVEGERWPVYVHVIDHPAARVLVDTGMTELALADGERTRSGERSPIM